MTDAELERAVLRVLAEATFPLRRRRIQNLALRTDLFGATRTVAALRSLEARKLVASAYNPNTAQGYGKWRITQAGRDALALVDVLDGEVA